MTYDLIIIGAGIVGLSTGMHLLQNNPNLKLLVLDKEEDVARHQTGNNSGVIHAGVYYSPGSLKAKFCFEGNKLTKDFCSNWDIPIDPCGKLLVATNEIEMQRMNNLWERTKENGLERYWLDASELKEKEPNISGLGAIHVPSSAIVDYNEISKKMAQIITQMGGEIKFNAEVLNIIESTSSVLIETSDRTFKSNYLISCAGLMADKIVKLLGVEPDFKICPFRGEYFTLKNESCNIVNHLIYPIPDPSLPFLGVHLTKMIDGSTTVGPNAVLAFKREGYKKTDFSFSDFIEILKHSGTRRLLYNNLKPGIRELRNSLFKSWYLKEVNKYAPSVKIEDLEDYPSGVRAQAVSPDGKMIDDFKFVHTRKTINVCNAPSPAATSAIPIGKHISELAEQQFLF